MISVCMATHNGGKYVREQITSILEQLSEEDELVVSDDGSTDHTLTELKAIKDKRIKIFTYQQTKDFSKRYLSSYYYATANFQNALLQAKGDFIFLSDQDDIWCCDKVARTLEVLQNHDLVVSNFSIVNESGEQEVPRYYTHNPYQNASVISMLKEMPFRGCCLAFRREVLEQALPFPEDLFLHDCWIGLIAYFRRMRLAYIDTPLIKYRRHSNNVSDLESKNSLLFKLKYRFRLLWLMAWH